MRVIIPAAGTGTRLRPWTRDRPKALVPIAGRPLLTYTLEWLAELAVDDVVVVVGHAREPLCRQLLACERRPPLSFVVNEAFATTNSIASLGLTTQQWDRPVCIIDGDVLADPELLARLVAPGPTALAVDRSRDARTADMKVELRDGRIWHLDKCLEAGCVHGEFFGLSRWCADDAMALARSIHALLGSGASNVWYEFAVRELAKHRELGVLPAAADEWAEVDAAEDIPAAEELVQRVLRRADVRSRRDP